MKTFIVIVSLAFCFQAFAFLPNVVEAPVDHVFVPHGFDNNDHVEVIVTGKFPNPCFVRNKYDVKVKNDVIKIDITSLSKEDPSSAKCEPLKVPFTEVVNIGNIQGGEYKIVVNEGGAYERTDSIIIGNANSQSIDENIYAMVEYVETGFTGGASGDALLIANSPSPCLVVDGVKYLTNKKDVLSVMPIMKKISSDCPEQNRRIEIPIKFDLKKFNSKNVLLFVRTIEGRSIHKIISR